jgi:hypothetical protein
MSDRSFGQAEGNECTPLGESVTSARRATEEQICASAHAGKNTNDVDDHERRGDEPERYLPRMTTQSAFVEPVGAGVGNGSVVAPDPTACASAAASASKPVLHATTVP